MTCSGVLRGFAQAQRLEYVSTIYLPGHSEYRRCYCPAKPRKTRFSVTPSTEAW